MENLSRSSKGKVVYTDLFHYFVMKGIDEVDDVELKINNFASKSLTRWEKRQLERRKNRNRNRTKPFRSDNRLSSKRVDWSKYIDFDYYDNDDNDYILEMLNDWFNDHPIYEDMSYNEYLLHLKEAS